MTRTTVARAFAFGLIAALAAGCGGPKTPEWVTKGSGAFKKDKKVFYGVGIVEGIQSEALKRTTADNRAINEIAKQLSTLSTSLMRDYMASTAVPAEQKGNEEQYVENTIKTFTSNVVSGVRIIDHYEGKNTYYALAALELDDLRSLAGEVKGLSAEVREHIKENAENAFDKLSEEEMKHSN